MGSIDEMIGQTNQLKISHNCDTYEIDILKNKKYLIATYWTYPFGGGEEFMFDTMEWATRLGMRCFWLAFADSKNKIFEELEIHHDKNGIRINIPGGFGVQKLSDWLTLIDPDIVHHQGNMREQFYLATEERRIEFLSGIHFWNGCLNLDPEVKNIQIIENYEKHKTDPEFERLSTKKRCTMYCASKFVQDVIQKISGIFIENVIFPSSSQKRYFIKNDPNSLSQYSSDERGKYVTMINIHVNKGGGLFLHLLNSCPDICFACVRTEHESDEMDKMIKDCIEMRNNNPDKYAKCLWIERTSDVKQIYLITRIMVCCSLVDETFCRVVNESMMNGIPVLTTHRGNIQYLIRDGSPILDPNNPDEWIEHVRSIYKDPVKYDMMSKKMLELYEYSSENFAKNQFKNMIIRTLSRSKLFDIGIMVPWCDQGLGIQARNYYRILCRSKMWRIHIFSLKPYNADSCTALQKNQFEWIVDEPNTIYSSPNCREDVRDLELIEFCRRTNIGKMIIPETCWKRIFQIAHLLKRLGVNVYCIPNIEIVRKDELFKHNYFYKTLANNYLCENIFKKHLTIPVEYIGYGIDGIEMSDKFFDPLDQVIRFVFVGGMNAFSRKNILECCEGFCMAYEKNPNIRLTCTVQMTNSLEQSIRNSINKYLDHPAINIIQSHLTYQQIIDLYRTHHIGFQISKHEGLGLGFYELLSTGTPIITLDTPPHNEIVINEVNGWTVECYYKNMTDNQDPLFCSAYVKPEKICQKILEIANKQTILDCIDRLKIDYKKRLSIEVFTHRFIQSLIS